MKISQRELTSVIGKLTKELDSLSLNYHLTGGVVSSFYGEPRYTQDVDLVIHLVANQVPALVENLATDFMIDEPSAKESVRRSRLFQALDNETYIKIDFHVGEAIPGELTRSRRVELFKGLNVKIASIEDAILSKVHWVKLGSNKSRDDIKGMFESEHPINQALLQDLAQKMGLSDLLEEFLPTGS